MQSLNVGAAWSCRCDAIHVDGPSGILRLEQADGSTNVGKRAARMVHRLVGAAVDHKPLAPHEFTDANPLLENNFVVTDGAHSYTSR